MTMWGHLERIGGSEDTTTVPNRLELHDTESFVGRFAEPVKSADSKFTHKTQALIPCLFVSSTHFSLGVTGKPGEARTFYIKDFSRNGTYLNEELIGPNRTVEFKDGDEISLRYKNKVRIQYRFSAAASPVKTESARKESQPMSSKEISQVKEEQEESSRFASMRSQADSVEYALNKQIAALQEESKQREQRLQQQASKIETLTSEFNKSSEKVTALEKLTANFEKEKNDLNERLATNESHCSAIEARNSKLEDQLEEARSEYKDLRGKMTNLSEELKTKTEQLETRNKLMETSNKTMTHEKSKWTKLENKYTTACAQLKNAQETIDRYTTSIHTLQGVVSDKEAEIAAAKQQNHQLRSVLETGLAAVQGREQRFAVLQEQLAATLTTLTKLSSEGTKLTAQKDYLHELTSALESHTDWASQQSARAEDTYAEMSYQSQQQAMNKLSPPREYEALSPASLYSAPGTPEATRVPPVTGTINGADYNSPDGASGHPHRNGRTNGTIGEGEKLDIESESYSSPMAAVPAPTATTDDSQSLRPEKRKRDYSDGADLSVTPKKPLTGKASMKKHSAGSAENDSDGDGDHDDGDMQATQGPADFAHLFVDSDQEKDREEQEGEQEGEEEHPTAPQQQEGGETSFVEETVQIMEVVESERRDECVVVEDGLEQQQKVQQVVTTTHSTTLITASAMEKDITPGIVQEPDEEVQTPAHKPASVTNTDGATSATSVSDAECVDVTAQHHRGAVRTATNGSGSKGQHSSTPTAATTGIAVAEVGNHSAVPERMSQPSDCAKPAPHPRHPVIDLDGSSDQENDDQHSAPTASSGHKNHRSQDNNGHDSSMKVVAEDEDDEDEVVEVTDPMDQE